MTLREIQELSLKLNKIIYEFNRNCMPEGYFICEDNDGTIVITDEEKYIQTNIDNTVLDNEKLTKEEILALFKKCSF